jgi:hypothetical protein
MWWARLLNVISGLLSGGAAPAAATSYESIATTTLGANQLTISFTSIPSTYKHLQIRLLARTDRAGNPASNVLLNFNSDTSANYSYHDLDGDGASAYSSGSASTSNIATQRISGNTAGANVFGAIVIDILDYQNTNKYKTVRYLGGYDNNGGGEIYLGSGNWRSTSAITQIDLTSINGTANFKQYSSFALYGIKG